MTKSSPQLAYDAFPKQKAVGPERPRAPVLKGSSGRLAYDEEGSYDQGEDVLREFLTKLSREDWIALWDDSHPTAMDQPPPFPGRPVAGKGPPAMDGLNSRLPDARKVRSDALGIQAKQKTVPTTSKQRIDFNDRFPDAGRIAIK